MNLVLIGEGKSFICLAVCGSSLVKMSWITIDLLIISLSNEWRVLKSKDCRGSAWATFIGDGLFCSRGSLKRLDLWLILLSSCVWADIRSWGPKVFVCARCLEVCWNFAVFSTTTFAISTYISWSFFELREGNSLHKEDQRRNRSLVQVDAVFGGFY